MSQMALADLTGKIHGNQENIGDDVGDGVSGIFPMKF